LGSSPSVLAVVKGEPVSARGRETLGNAALVRGRYLQRFKVILQHLGQACVFVEDLQAIFNPPHVDGYGKQENEAKHERPRSALKSEAYDAVSHNENDDGSRQRRRTNVSAELSAIRSSSAQICLTGHRNTGDTAPGSSCR